MDHVTIRLDKRSETISDKGKQQLQDVLNPSACKNLNDLPSILPHELDQLLDDNDVLLEAINACQKLHRIDEAQGYIRKLQDNLTLLSYHAEIYNRTRPTEIVSHPKDPSMIQVSNAYATYMHRIQQRAASYLEVAKLYDFPPSTISKYAEEIGKISK